MQWRKVCRMNAINRLEETWTPSWDLGLQAEFGFFSDVKEEKQETPLTTGTRPNAWAMAGKEVLNRQTSPAQSLEGESSNLAEVIKFLETLSEMVVGDE